MRTLKLQAQMTLDGFVGGPNGEMDWMTMPWTDDVNAYVEGLLKNVDCMLLGRKLAQGFIPYWAGVADDKDNPEQSSGKYFTNLRKVVFSNSLDESPWADKNATLASGDLVEAVNRLKQEEGGDLYVCGGATFVSELIRHNLIDEYHLFINPVAIGKGLPIFDKLENRQNLKLLKSLSFQCGITVLNYVSDWD
ncbi:dihydrofolate reductase family protein [Roseivirga sp. BDSF3-8]|uniref:dihydrofolate reductase family protein n=1 Tax=Roseivirga sp. BDSF3-8 TaxID=3241598 RepID=UPI00353204C3